MRPRIRTTQRMRSRSRCAISTRAASRRRRRNRRSPMAPSAEHKITVSNRQDAKDAKRARRELKKCYLGPLSSSWRLGGSFSGSIDITPKARPKRVRLDQLLVDRGLAESRSQAQALILAGNVRVADAPVTKAGTPVAADSAIELTGQRRFVSRGGEKLAHALDAFAIAVTGL